MAKALPVVVIVGGGFAGLSAAKALRRAPVKMLLIDRTNHHLFQPLLYQVAICALSPSQIAAPYAPGLKSLGDAVGIRHKILRAFEQAEAEDDPAAHRDLLTFVLVGAGPTGVEMAGALAGFVRNSLRSQFRRIDPTSARIVLVDMAEKVLGVFPEPLSIAARQRLERLGVDIRVAPPAREGVRHA